MRRLRCLSLLFACLLAVPACKDAEPKPSQPLTWGDAEWPEAPIPLPGGEGEDNGGGDGDTDGGSGGTSLSFVPSADFAGVSECDPFIQDCPEGEKCVAYASTGGNFDANKCVPVTGSGMPGEACSYGGVVEATDDCNDIAYCWDVMDMMGALEGTCTQFCGGSPDAPQCPVGYECLIAYDGSVNLCIDNSGGTDTGGTDTGGLPDQEDPEIDAPPLEPHEEQLDEPVCPDTTDPIVLYMSNDDSNSQASPAIVRRLIHDGMTVSTDRVRIHEFLNYYSIAYDNPVDKPAEVGIQMRRTNADSGEFTLLLYAQGQLMREEDRPPLNLVFSLDTSGSMSGERISLVKDSMVALAGELRIGDVISLVEWDTTTVVPLQNHTVTGPDDPVLLAAIQGLDAGGSTDLHGGLVKAYELAEASYVEGGINRVILMSDGGANAGETSIELIAEKAAANDGSGVYLVGVGVGPAGTYNDGLMDAVTDAGKGAYVFIDDPAEAELQFADRFLSNVAVAARNVQMRMTLPWYFGIKSFHGEEYSSDPAEVEPQHLAPNDAMSFHQIIAACDPESINAGDTIEAHVEYLHPLTLEPMSDTLKVEIGALVKQDATQLYKADVVVGFAKALIVIGYYLQQGEQAKAISIAEGMKAWLAEAAETLADPEVEEMATLMGEYWTVLGGN
jgi:Mg-chelatase subunit ChlD